MHLGDEIGPRQRAGPQAAQIAAYVGTSGIRGSLFTDPVYARALGYRDVIAPGPMLTAFLEQFLRSELPGWQLERLSTTFRLPTIAGAHLLLRGAVTEHHEMTDGERIVCDLVIEHPDRESAVTGTATLRRYPQQAAGS
jgi:hypothetical protein